MQATSIDVEPSFTARSTEAFAASSLLGDLGVALLASDV